MTEAKRTFSQENALFFVHNGKFGGDGAVKVYKYGKEFFGNLLKMCKMDKNY
ncbi:hypothetical protein [Butyricicoccus pullicaecorum]|uniref:hypothetical protein n=1 Tax=Butyricicoccus pullicaecorum TaxID=501571 RepID=UPI001A9A3F79|nr:hypothetical protein [Butyricicoccus pullicaecorum]